MIIKPFEAFHVELLRAQGVQTAQLSEVSIVPATYERVPGPALSAFHGDRVLICAGVVPRALGHAECWALLSQEAGRHMTALHYAAKRFLSIQRFTRLEASVEEGFGAGCRWLELLGFEFEGAMKGYGVNGETHLRYGKT